MRIKTVIMAVINYMNSSVTTGNVFLKRSFVMAQKNMDIMLIMILIAQMVLMKIGKSVVF